MKAYICHICDSNIHDDNGEKDTTGTNNFKSI